MITIKIANTAHETEECFRIREEVFIIEQNVPVDMERDKHDKTALHFLVLEDGQAIGTGRVVLKNKGTVAKIGRVAVLSSKRGLGIGKLLIVTIEESSELKCVDKFVLEAQTHALKFYETLGYEAYRHRHTRCQVFIGQVCCKY